MKYFALLLSIYTFYLVSAPCVDDALQISKQVTGQTSPMHPATPPDHADACSPFCICSCCSVPVTLSPGVFIGQPFYDFRETIMSEPPTFYSSFSVSFWQPPKLG